MPQQYSPGGSTCSEHVRYMFLFDCKSSLIISKLIFCVEV